MRPLSSTEARALAILLLGPEQWHDAADDPVGCATMMSSLDAVVARGCATMWRWQHPDPARGIVTSYDITELGRLAWRVSRQSADQGASS